MNETATPETFPKKNTPAKFNGNHSPVRPSDRLKIAILTLGTRGDVQPYLSLGQAFLKRGHQVTLCTGKNFESMAKSYGINFVPIEADFQAFLNSHVGKRVLKMHFGATRHLKKWVYPMIYDALHAFYALAKENDRVLFNVKTQADHFADQFPEKMIRANVVPTLQPTNEFVNPALKSLFIPPFFNRFSYKLYEMSMQMMKSRISAFRKHVGLPKTYKRPPLPSIYGISTHFLEKPEDFPDNSYFTGFWPDISPEPLAQDLVDFVNAGEPPLLITFGSMPFDSKMNLAKTIRRLSKELNIRIILARGWGVSHTEELNDLPEIKVIEAAPFDKLIPLVRAVVHHGGAGTTSSCLQAGKPFMTCPVLYPLGDQEFWGTIAYEKGVAIKPIPLRKMTEDTFIRKAKELLESSHLYHNSHRLMQHLKTEDGLLNAVNLVEKRISSATTAHLTSPASSLIRTSL